MRHSGRGAPSGSKKIRTVEEEEEEVVVVVVGGVVVVEEEEEEEEEEEAPAVSGGGTCFDWLSMRSENFIGSLSRGGR